MAVYDGRFEGIEGPIEYVVIGGWDNIWKDDETEYGKRDLCETNFMIPLGTYTNINEAYGKALLYLNGLICDREKEYITPLTKLKDDQGMIMGIRGGEDSTVYTWTQILWRYPEEREDNKYD